MGLFGGDDPNQQANDLTNQQIQQNQAEIENKRQSLYKERLDIVKGQGMQSWSPEMKSTAMGQLSQSVRGIGKDAAKAVNQSPLGGTGKR